MARLDFKGKTFVQNYHLAVKYHELVPVKSKSLTKKVSLHDNLIIHGDNLIALKALLPIYAGKVKCIYIDPPYNTGNEGWVYNDNVNSPMMQDWLGKVVDKEDLTRHDKWLCMMMPRLKLLRELLAPDGIIAITIDDNELFDIGLLLNEIFGEDKILACAPWLAEPSGGKEKTGLRGGHEYVLIYHNGDSNSITQEERSTGDLNLKDSIGPYRKGRELRKWGGTSLRSDRPGQWYALKAPDGTNVFPIRNDGREGHWRWGKDNPKIIQILQNSDLLHWEKRPYDEGAEYNGQTERWVPYVKIRDKKKSVGWSTWLDSYGFNADGTRELKDIFGKKIFETPKPTTLIQWIISLHCDENAIVLDSFPGSGTTAQAVLALNKEDGGNRRFILIECEDYADKITAERVRRVIKGVDDAKDEDLKNGYGGSFSYFDVGKPIEMDEILTGKNMPDYGELARYVFYTATGEEFDPDAVDEKNHFIGESKDWLVYLFYKPDMEYLKATALTLERAEALGPYKKKRRLVFAPTKYLDQDYLDRFRIDFAQLPFEIYKMAK
ncbi:MAG TPA: site-specific DNA-methyltransferase [Anaerohalosphaeraceae bacterium]|nr:site-specific DNA-methyltransferase [Anaerohalosphaeraceae bacterium]